MTEENWDTWKDHPTSEERAIYRFEAEKDQISFEDSQNCRMIHVRGKLVGAVDFTTEVKLTLHVDSPPALVFGRRGDPLYLFVYLMEWDLKREGATD